MLGIAAVIGFTFVVMWLWNWLVPELFNGPVLGYWQTLGLLILTKILFSGMGHGGSHHHPKRRYHDYDFPKSQWRQKFEARMKEKEEETEQKATE